MLVHLLLRRASLLNSSSKSAQHSTAPRTEEVSLKFSFPRRLTTWHCPHLLPRAVRAATRLLLLASRAAIDRRILNF